jgi:hypothetical protein
MTPKQIMRAVNRLEDQEGINAAAVVIGAAVKRGAAGTKADALKRISKNRGETLDEAKTYYGDTDWYLGVLIHAGSVDSQFTNADLILTDGYSFEMVKTITISPSEIKWETAAVLDPETMEFIGDPDEDNLRAAAEASSTMRSRRRY